MLTSDSENDMDADVTASPQHKDIKPIQVAYTSIRLIRLTTVSYA
jgi:hypothetical protein